MTRVRAGRGARRAARVLVVLAALAGLAVALPATSPPVVADTTRGLLAFLRSPDGNISYRLTVAETSGAGLREVTAQRAYGRPSFSPDGRSIVFSGPLTDDSDGRYGIFVVGTDGSGLRLLTAPQFADFDPVWSPDGRAIAFTRDVSGTLDLRTCCLVHVMSADGSAQRAVPGTTGGREPSWAPDGATLTYAAPDGLRVVRYDGVGNALVGTGASAWPAWSPDGRYIAYALRYGPTRSDLVTYDLATGATTTLVTNGQQVESPQWTRDSRVIHFLSYTGTGDDGRTGSTVWQWRAAAGAAPLPVQGRQLFGLAYTDLRSGPEGVLDLAQRSPRGVRLAGWAVDRDSAGPVPLHVYVDGGFSRTASADRPRPDLAPFFPGLGTAHGFDFTVPIRDAGTGVRQVCVYGIDDATPALNTLLACTSVGTLPFGSVDAAVPRPGGGVRVAGWTIDPDRRGPVAVHVYVDGVFAGNGVANGPRPDVGALYPAYGGAHGFSVPITPPPGPHTACVWALNDGPGNPLIGCLAVAG